MRLVTVGLNVIQPGSQPPINTQPKQHRGPPGDIDRTTPRTPRTRATKRGSGTEHLHPASRSNKT